MKRLTGGPRTLVAGRCLRGRRVGGSGLSAVNFLSWTRENRHLTGLPRIPNLCHLDMSRLDDTYSKLTIKTGAKLVLVVLDGLGDIATRGQGNMTPLEAARTPNLDALVAQGCAQGRMIPVAPGITPGSGPGHLALFGYDPLEFEVGRGVIETLGLGLELKAGDVAARANF